MLSIDHPGRFYHLQETITKFLTAIGLLYGKDSPEYEAAGGTRTSEAGK
jgi:hypothetical protein